MRSLLLTSALVLPFALPGAASAQELSFSAGVTAVSRVVMNGVRQSTGGAIQPWAEAEYNGFYAGFWATSGLVGGSKIEVDLYAGYRGSFQNLNYDIGYARYTYHNAKGPSSGELYVNLGVDVSDQVSLGAGVYYDPQAKVANVSANASYAINDKFSLDATVGKITRGGQQYWSLGANYAFNDSFGVGLAWHDSNIGPGTAVLSLDYSFSFR